MQPSAKNLRQRKAFSLAYCDHENPSTDPFHILTVPWRAETFPKNFPTGFWGLVSVVCMCVTYFFYCQASCRQEVIHERNPSPACEYSSDIFGCLAARFNDDCLHKRISKLIFPSQIKRLPALFGAQCGAHHRRSRQAKASVLWMVR